MSKRKKKTARQLYHMGMEEMTKRRLGHYSMNVAQDHYNWGYLSQDDYELIGDMHDANPHRFSSLWYERVRGYESLAKLFDVEYVKGEEAEPDA